MIRAWFETQLASLMAYAARNPTEFLFYVLLILSPFFAISAYLSWKLSKAIEKEEKVSGNRCVSLRIECNLQEKKRKAKMQAGIARSRELSDKKRD